MRKLFRHALYRLRAPMVLAAVVSLSACSGVQIGYRHADIFLAWKVNEYFDLDRAQSAMVNPRSIRRWPGTAKASFRPTSTC
ncbi:MAG: hypothetical protein WDN04_17825 [Rhodospirillales bacterium]